MQDYQRLLSSQPARRLNPAKLAESSVLKNKLVDTIAFLENLAVKDSSEKDLFFKRLPGAIPDLPLPVLRRKLLPMLAQALTFGGAPAVALGTILQVLLPPATTLCFSTMYTARVSYLSSVLCLEALQGTGMLHCTLWCCQVATVRQYEHVYVSVCWQMYVHVQHHACWQACQPALLQSHWFAPLLSHMLSAISCRQIHISTQV